MTHEEFLKLSDEQKIAVVSGLDGKLQAVRAQLEEVERVTAERIAFLEGELLKQTSSADQCSRDRKADRHALGALMVKGDAQEVDAWIATFAIEP